MDYYNKFYSCYVSTHKQELFNIKNTDDIVKMFPVLHKYYGRHLPKNKDIAIFEIGCGNGVLLYYLKHLGYVNSYGIDICEEQIEVARRNGIHNIEKADIKEYLKGRKQCYDVIIGRDILEHFSKEELMDVMQLIYTALKKDGMIIIQTPNGESPFSNIYRYGELTHELIFTRTSLYQILTVFNFKDIKYFKTGPVIHGFFSAVRYCLWMCIELLCRTYLLIEVGCADGIFTQNLICKAKKRS